MSLLYALDKKCLLIKILHARKKELEPEIKNIKEVQVKISDQDFQVLLEKNKKFMNHLSSRSYVFNGVRKPDVNNPCHYIVWGT